MRDKFGGILVEESITTDKFGGILVSEQTPTEREKLLASGMTNIEVDRQLGIPITKTLWRPEQEAEPQIEPEIDERPEGVEPIYQNHIV